MGLRDAIGIDPDSKGFVCATVKLSGAQVTTKGYLTTDSDLKAFLRWVKGQGETIVAIEGSNALNRPLEKALRESEVLFYSFQPAVTDKFRKASWSATGGCGLPRRSFSFSPVATRGSPRG